MTRHMWTHFGPKPVTTTTALVHNSQQSANRAEVDDYDDDNDDK